MADNILTSDEVQQVLNWAVGSAGMVMLMDAAPVHSDASEAEERIQGYIQAIQLMVDSMPECLLEPGVRTAYQALAEAQRDEEQIALFRQQLDEL